MPHPRKQIELADAAALIAARGFGTPGRACGTPHTVGVELESFAVPGTDPERFPAPALPAGSRLTFEPGGQIELSSPPATSVAQACDALSVDLRTVRQSLSPQGVELVQAGLAPGEPPRRVDSPRYRAMEAYFDARWGEDGRTMMCATASVQVNLGLGGAGQARRRWRAANVLGPVLAAAFSTSAPEGGNGSQRLAAWLRLDPERTGPVPLHADPRQAWVDYALAAPVMMIRGPAGHEALAGERLTCREWLERGHRLGWPSADDVAYHLTTLFPPVRPRGWLELRMIDSLPDPWWRVAVAVAAALVGDREAVAACEVVSGRWWEAATAGIGDPPLEAAVAFCAQRSLSCLGRVGTDMGTAMLVEQWAATVRKGCEPPWASGQDSRCRSQPEPTWA